MKLKFGRSTFRADPYEEDCRFNRLRYCFGDGGDGGDGGDDGSSGDDYGSDGFAGDTDASVGGGFASEGDTGTSFNEADWTDDPDAMGMIAETDADTTANQGMGVADEATGTEFNIQDWVEDEEAMAWAAISAMPDAEFDTESWSYDVYDDVVDAFNNPTTNVAMANAIAQGWGVASPYGIDSDPGFFSRGVNAVANVFGVQTEPMAFVDATKGVVGTYDPSVNPGTVAGMMIPGLSIKAGEVTTANSTYGVQSIGVGMGPISVSTDMYSPEDQTTDLSVKAGVGPFSIGVNVASDVSVTAPDTSYGDTDSGGGEEQVTDVQGYVTSDTDYQETVEAATGTSRSKLLPAFLASGKSAIDPFNYNPNEDPFGYFPYSRGRYKAAQGGLMDAQMNEVLPPELPKMDPVALKNTPEKFLKNPMRARDEAERQSIYAYNKRVLDEAAKPLKARLGMEVPPTAPPPVSQEAAPGGPNGIIGGTPPEQLPDDVKVADDVPMDVPEGSFILNAAAVEFAGSADIEKMIAEAAKIAAQKGIDISPDGNTIDPKELANLLVSKGEVVISPALAQIIGYDRLEKINNRGKKETQQRIAENGQDAPPGTQTAAEGGEQGFAKPKRTKDELYNDPRTEEELKKFNQVILQNKDKNFVQRMLDANSKGMPVEGEPGTEKTHRMNAEYFPDTDEWVAFPSVVQKPSGEMYDYGDDVVAAGDHARSTGEYISFGKDADAAIRFSIHYKDSDAWNKGRGSKKKMAYGGDTKNSVADTEVIDIYRAIVAQGGDPGRFEVFEEAFRKYQEGKAYRPMQSEVGTPEFDAEVRRKYGYAFPETKGGMLEESTYQRAPD